MIIPCLDVANRTHLPPVVTPPCLGMLPLCHLLPLTLKIALQLPSFQVVPDYACESGTNQGSEGSLRPGKALALCVPLHQPMPTADSL